jgi:ATP-dependent Clp protease ATP-binding subunit ClpA
MDKEKTIFVENVRRWAALDKQLKAANQKTKEWRAEKSQIADQITEYLETRNLADKPIELSDGAIHIVEKREYPPLSFSYVEECLDALIQDKSHVEAILDYLHENREVRVVTDLKRVYRQDK